MTQVAGDVATGGAVIVWLRRDLRLADNPALAAAASSGRPAIPVFILDESPGMRPPGGASRWWLDKSLAALERGLAERGSRLILRRGPAAGVLDDLIAETGAGMVVWNRLYDPDTRPRDSAIKADLRQRGLDARSFNAALLNEPHEVLTGQGEGFKVFGGYWRAARRRLGRMDVSPAPDRVRSPAAWPWSERFSDWGLHPRRPDWSGGFSDWTPGELGAQARLARFVDQGLADYGAHRDLPARQATSRLSPHLHFGEVGPRQVWNAVWSAVTRGEVPEGEADKFVSELGWREFNHHLLHFAPHMVERSWRPSHDAMAWREDEAGLAAWSRGLTGYPFVDAGMRELWATGFMENRVRMVAASFLIKDLLIDWRRGEAWFWDTLLDADPANNAGNWQWVAGSGADASPWFRIFNPVGQGEKFDPRGDYVRRWVPELARLPDAVIHRPWTADPALLAARGVVLGRDYPHPIVDHAAARVRALEAHGEVRSVGGGPSKDRNKEVFDV